MRALASFTLLYTILECSAVAQTLVPARPLRHRDPEGARRERELRLQLPSKKWVMRPVLDHRLAPLDSSEIAQNKAAAISGASFAGLHRSVPGSFLEKGRLDIEGGRQIWRAALRSPGAGGVRVHFTKFDIGSGRLWVHDGSGEESEIHGPYTGKGPYGDGDFWSDIVLNEHIMLEYEPSAEMGPVDRPPFEVGEISHLLAEALAGFSESKSEAPRPAASCNMDVTCFPEWAETAKAVAHIVFEQGGQTFVCSGTLVNTRNDSRVPYFLTAQHCIASDTVARTVNAFWFYQTSRCNGTPPNRRDVPRTLGARYIFGTPVSSGDATLLQLNSIPDGVNFSGWDPAPFEAGKSVVGIHHPDGDYKRISIGESRSAVRFGGRDLDTFLGAFWNGGGLTEGGSSGSGLFKESLVLVGMLSHGPKADTAAEYCAMLPFADNYGRFSNFYPFISDILEGRSTNPNPNPGVPPASAGSRLTSGQPRSFSLPAVTAPSLFRGESSYTIEVPEGATRLEVTLRSTTPNVDVDLYVRRGQDVELENGRVVADFRSEGDLADERIVVTGANLQPGTYFIAFGVFTTNTVIQLTVTATVTTGAPPPSGGTRLTSGEPREFTLAPVANATLFRGENSFTIEVPEGATRLEVLLSWTTPDSDVDLYVRRGQDVALENNRVVADFRSTQQNSSSERVVISGSQLQPGTYFIAFAVFTRNTRIAATLTATVSTGEAQPPASGRVLTSGQAETFSTGPVTSATLFRGENSFTINVPQNATRLEITLRTRPETADVDLYARAGQDTALENGRVVADARSEGPDGNETIVISGAALRPGPYFISYALFSTNMTVQCTLTATVTTGTATPGVLTSGTPVPYRVGPVSSPTLINGTRGFRIEVPEGATRLDIRLASPSPAEADVDLYARFGTDVTVTNGRANFDHSSEGPLGTESITILPSSSPALRAGTYFIALGLFSTDVEVSGTITATVVKESAVPAPNEVTVLTSGVGAKFALPAVERNTLFHGNYSFRINVPEGAARLTVQLRSDVPAVDTDLFVRAAADPDLDEEGRVVADYASTSRLPDETIVINSLSSPPLRAGEYFISIGVFTKGVATTGTITATVERAASEGATETEAALRSVKVFPESREPLLPKKRVLVERGLDHGVSPRLNRHLNRQ